jgi:hypothetical protein
MSSNHDDATGTEADRAGVPSTVFLALLLGAVILAGHRFAPYVVHPEQTHGWARYLAATIIGLAVGFSFSTLNSLGYCLIFLRHSEDAKTFFAAVSNRAAVGATLGTLLGLRLISPLATLSLVHRQPGASPADLIGDIGNAATFVTLVAVATAWPYAVGPVWRTAKLAFIMARQMIGSRTGRFDWVWSGGHGLIAGLVLVAGNLLGIDAGFAAAYLTMTS